MISLLSRHLLCLLLGCLAWVQAEEIRLANGEWQPYLSETLPHYGFASRIVTAAFERVGVTVRYEFYPWARAQSMVEQGTIAGSVVWSRTPERLRFAFFSDPVITDEEVLFHLKEKPLQWQQFSDLRGLTMATPLGSKLGVWEVPIREGLVINLSALNVETGMKMLLAGRIDFFPLARTVGYQTLRAHFTPAERERIVHATKVAEQIDYRLMLSRQVPGNRALLERFNEGLGQLRRSGDYARLESELLAGKFDQAK
ncbi:substrate-binding periplasmic protein [Chitinimonas lacunae]|uniref:Substrate-binding periplasmic protein n=1 Tax=Chitinimonas lacunae TaxID=1963018 RepID=A0ABV8MRW3_9NEIS